MKKLNSALMAVTIAFSAIATPTLASAQQNDPITYIQDRERVRPEDRRHDDRRHDARHDDRRNHHERRRDNDLTIGILGLTAGAIIGGAIVEDRRHAPPPRYRPPVREHRYGFIRPWSPEWYRWCSNRYRSFNPRTGTFVAYDGLRQFCDANR